MNFNNIYFISFIFAAFTLAILFLLKSKGDKKANRIMSGMLLLFGYYIFYSLLFWNKEILHKSSVNWIHLNKTHLIPISLIGAFFYGYIKKILCKEKFGITGILNFLPLIFLIITFGKYYIQSADSKLSISKNESITEFVLLTDNLVASILVFSMIVHGVLSYRLFLKVKPEDKDIQIWTKAISLTYLALASSFLIYYALWYMNILTSNQDYFISFLITVFIALVGYFAFMQPDIFNGKPIHEVIPLVKKYQKTGLSKEYSAELKLKLMNIINEDQIYLRNDLGLMDIANALRISRNHASQVINEHFNMSFYDFINKFRIIEAERMINSDLNLNFTEIAYTVGFNNRISFYKAFKKFTGLNPSQYLENRRVS
ncbi:MAG: helix-turn-helix domain-containing protein [Flavobacteriaceae bacterium]|nr:helix-turn-helix domain-containing protein [Flavobacteriaceae bacterium]